MIKYNDLEMILGYLVVPNVITRVLIRERGSQEGQKRNRDNGSRCQSGGIAGRGHEPRIEGNF